MRSLCFGKRSFKEIIRDPLSIIFAVLLPLFLLFIFQQFNIPSEVYKIENFTVGIIVFGFSFISMFTATLVARDRSTSLLVRLCVSPMRGSDYVLGYTLAVIPLVFIQNILFFTVAVMLNLKATIGIIYVILGSLLISLLFIGIGIIIGSITTDKSAAGACSFVVQIVAFTSGMYFEPKMAGGFFNTLCKILPFSNAVDILKGLLNMNIKSLMPSLLTFGIYLIAVIIISVLVFNKNKSD